MEQVFASWSPELTLTHQAWCISYNTVLFVPCLQKAFIKDVIPINCQKSSYMMIPVASLEQRKDKLKKKKEERKRKKTEVRGFNKSGTSLQMKEFVREAWMEHEEQVWCEEYFITERSILECDLFFVP